MTDKFALFNGTLPVVSLLLGGFLQFMFTRAAEARKQVGLLRNQANVDYLRSVAKLAHCRDASDAARDASLSAADAKARIAICGTKLAISALARFEETGADLRTAEALEKFVGVAASMRDDDVNSADLRLVLFGPELPSNEN